MILTVIWGNISGFRDDLSNYQEVGVQFRTDTLLESFNPSAPIDRRNVFAGRSDQLAALYTVIRQRGQHAVIYGERGVGKTSLASIVADQANQLGLFTAHVICKYSEIVWLPMGRIASTSTNADALTGLPNTYRDLRQQR